jgi:4-hydroxybenzoate polyprenyltransferase
MILEAIIYRAIQRAVWYYRTVRVLDWRAYLGIAILGFTYGLDKSLLYANYDVLVKFIVSNILYLAFTFSINNCFDIKCDKQRREKLRKNPVASGLISFKEGVILSSCIASIGLASTYLWFNVAPFLLYTMLVFLGMAYSTPPLRFKSVPIIDLVTHGLFFGVLLFLYGILVGGSWSPQAFFMGVSIFVCSVTFELQNHLKDFEADKISGTKTAACWLGLDKARDLLKILLVLHWLLLIVVLWTTSFLFALTTSGVLIFALYALQSRLNYQRITDVSSCIVYASAASSYLIQLITISR